MGLGAVLALISGWRQGAVASLFSAVGIGAGLVLGAAAAPFVMSYTDQVALRFLLAGGLVVLLVGLGQIVGASVGATLRDRMKQRSQQRWDSIAGALFQVIVAMLIVVLISVPLASGLKGALGRGIRESTVVANISRVTPAPVLALPARIAAMLNENGLPPLVSPWEGIGGKAVEPPAVEIADTELVNQVRPGVIHVLGDADACSRRLMGSGFVTAPDYVVTNAHVVAGTNTVALDTIMGVKEATVVYYNPEVDVAVLYSPGLDLPVLPWAETPASSGDDAIVMGFPQSGPFTASPARVRERLKIAGPDIYAVGRVERDAYTVRGNIRQGNSGGPMLNLNGEVIGVVFGASVDDSDTGYALTAEEVRRQVGDVHALTTAVETGECVSH